MTERRTRWYPGAPLAWVAVFVASVAADAALGRWVVFPVFVVGFYGGVVAVELLTYPLLGWWRARLRSRGPRAWYLVAVGGLGASPAAVLASLAPLWLGWGWGRVLPLQVAGASMLILSVGVGAWAMGHMGWARLLLAPAIFPPDTGSEDRAPRRLVVEGPYRYVRHPLYGADLGVLLGTALLTSKWAPVVLAGLYPVALGIQVHLEERELEARLSEAYVRYRRLVPRFVPRLKPVDPAEVHETRSGTRQ